MSSRSFVTVIICIITALLTPRCSLMLSTACPSVLINTILLAWDRGWHWPLRTVSYCHALLASYITGSNLLLTSLASKMVCIELSSMLICIAYLLHWAVSLSTTALVNCRPWPLASFYRSLGLPLCLVTFSFFNLSVMYVFGLCLCCLVLIVCPPPSHDLVTN